MSDLPSFAAEFFSGRLRETFGNMSVGRTAEGAGAPTSCSRTGGRRRSPQGLPGLSCMSWSSRRMVNSVALSTM
ncbi:hypothetical protein ABH940_001175 [Streptacidiphilus sp. BW17]